MYWEEGQQGAVYRVPDDVVDLSFKIRCRSVPADHAYSLKTALERVLPWLADEPQVGVHAVYGADSGNGWIRPDGDAAVIHLPRRVRLNLRLPKRLVEQGTRLEGHTLDLAGYPCAVGESKVLLLSTHGTLFARCLTPAASDEETFLNAAARMLAELGIHPPKMMGGLSRVIRTPEGDVATRSLMIDGLTPPESVLVQQRGLGERHELGCGIFLPHKGIDAVRGEPRGAAEERRRGAVAV